MKSVLVANMKGGVGKTTTAATVAAALDWSRPKEIGETPPGLDWLVIDAPGALRGERAETLVAESDAVVTPLTPSAFDIRATAKFLEGVEEMKRVRKGKAALILIANRVRRGRALDALERFFAETGRAPAARIGDRAAYVDLAGQGLSVFDRPAKAYEPLRAEWRPLIAAIGG